jgi:hypothetical protein
MGFLFIKTPHRLNYAAAMNIPCKPVRHLDSVSLIHEQVANQGRSDR